MAKKDWNTTRGQAARVANSIDTNIVFSRAHQIFLKTFGRDPLWDRASIHMDIKGNSLVCEIREEQ